MPKEKAKTILKAKKQKIEPVAKKIIPLKKAAAKVANRYLEGIGRRKTALARVRLLPGGEAQFLVNGVDLKKYFPTAYLQGLANASLNSVGYPGLLGVEARVRGGGICAQAEAVRLGISRAMVKLMPDSYKNLRKLGYLTRDQRMRERKKFGLKRARKAPQWQKR